MEFNQKGPLVTARIYINIEADTAAEARSHMAELLGTTVIFAEPKVDAAALTEVGENIVDTQASAAPAPEEPMPPKARRAKKADKPAPRYFKADGEDGPQLLMTVDGAQPAIEGIEEITKEQFEEIGAKQKPVIEDTVEDQAQDAADEAAETAAEKTDTLTLGDVRKALGDYVKAYGMEAAQADGPVLIAKVLGVAVDSEKPKKISDLGDDQALIKRAVEGVAEMIAKNPFNRTAKAA